MARSQQLIGTKQIAFNMLRALNGWLVRWWITFGRISGSCLVVQGFETESTFGSLAIERGLVEAEERGLFSLVLPRQRKKKKTHTHKAQPTRPPQAERWP